MIDKEYFLTHAELPPYCEIAEVSLISGKEVETPGGFLPEHVRVSVTARPEEGSMIRIELWLPTKEWNGDLAGIGNGGYAGNLPTFLLGAPLRMGFAVVTTDMGTSAGPDCGIGNVAVWKDFGYRATHLMAVIAKELVHAYYGEEAAHSYFVGGSTGGQQALSEAQRYPEDFDGILACAPAYDRIDLHLAFLWDWQHLNAPGTEPITQEQEKLLVASHLRCFSLEGERHGEDPFFYRPDRIHISRDYLASLGFTKSQVEALLAVYSGMPGKHGATLTPGSEAGGLSLAYRCDKETFAREFFYLFRWVLGAGYDFTSFCMETDGERIRKALGGYLDATSTDLTAFRDRDGKLLLLHGTADPIIPMASSIRYYEDVQQTMGKVDGFFRLFLAPGMDHVFGGPGVQDFVYALPATPRDEKHLGLLALKAWVEKGAAPDSLIGVSFRSDCADSAYRADGIAWERECKPYGF